MIFTLFAVALFWVASWFLTKRLRAFVGGMHAPRDIREEQTLLQRIVMAAFGVLSPFLPLAARMRAAKERRPSFARLPGGDTGFCLSARA